MGAFIVFVNSTFKSSITNLRVFTTRVEKKKSQTGNAVKGDESKSIKRETFGLKSCL